MSDCISRQAVINLIRGCNSALEEPRIFDTHNSGTIFEHYITELPSVNPHETVTEFADRCRECGAKYGKLLKQEPKTGHWNTTDYFIFKCSECECEERTDTRFCPNCGAKMEGKA